MDQVNAIKTVKRKITDLDKSKIEEQKKAVRAGYDMDIIPSDLATYGAEAKKLLQDLQSRNERMFLLTFLIMNTADTPRQLDNNIFQTSSIAQKYNCALTRLDFQQEEGLMSSLPLGMNQIEISDLQGRNRELEKQIRELEDTDIIGMVRENGMTMEQFAELFRRMQGAPAPITSEQEEPSHE